MKNLEVKVTRFDDTEAGEEVKVFKIDCNFIEDYIHDNSGDFVKINDFTVVDFKAKLFKNAAGGKYIFDKNYASRYDYKNVNEFDFSSDNGDQAKIEIDIEYRNADEKEVDEFGAMLQSETIELYTNFTF